VAFRLPSRRARIGLPKPQSCSTNGPSSVSIGEQPPRACSFAKWVQASNFYRSEHPSCRSAHATIAEHIDWCEVPPAHLLPPHGANYLKPSSPGITQFSSCYFVPTSRVSHDFVTSSARTRCWLSSRSYDFLARDDTNWRISLSHRPSQRDILRVYMNTLGVICCATRLARA
jgi:hypothetical protein